MSLSRRFLFTAPTALGLLAATALSAHAITPSDRTLFTWNGTVDREVLLFVRGRNVETRASGLDASFAPRLEMRDELPRQFGDIDVHIANGRGSVEVVQQPSARNDFTAIVRVSDPRAGTDRYRVVVSWTPAREGKDARDRDDRDGSRDVDRGRDRDRDRSDDRSNDRGNDRGNDRWDTRRDDGQLSWRGDVDDVAEIRIQGRRVEYFTRSGQPLRNVRYDVNGAGLPRHPVNVQLDVSRGRGSVIVTQQPNPSNGFTAVIRVIDRRSGYGDYDFNLRWF